MSRRDKPRKRKIIPDERYGSEVVSKFICCVMLKGKKTLAKSIVYKAIENLSRRLKSNNPLECFEKSLENSKPSIEVRSRRVGGSNFPVPMEIGPDRRHALGIRWIVKFARKKSGKTMADGLTQELFDCYNNQGTTIKKKEDVHKMAESNKAFAHYRW